MTITIDPPADTGCHAMLDALGIDWAPASATRGIADPVRVQPLIGGVRYRYVSNAEPTAMTMGLRASRRVFITSAASCSATAWTRSSTSASTTTASIGGGDPDSGTCTPSMHAQARALDIWGLGLAADDTEYALERD
ncbi:MAG: hypothetical protein R3B99_27045 [Polyangiales bacterium]